MRTLSEALAADGVTLTYTSDIYGHDRRFNGTFHFQDRTLPHEWSQSADSSDITPGVAEILAPALRHAMTAEAAEDYEDWAGDFSFDRSEWPSRETYTQWLTIAQNLRKFLGDERYESYSSDNVQHDD